MSRALAMTAWLLTLAAPTCAQQGVQPDNWFSSTFTAHCGCEIAGASASPVYYSFGTIATYKGLFPQGSNDQAACTQACRNAFGSLNAGYVCEGFRQSGGCPLTAYWTLGTIGWTDSGAAETTASFGYPNNCPGYTLSHIYPSFLAEPTIYTPPGCTQLSTPGAFQCNNPWGFPGAVQYATGSTAGETISMQNSFKSVVMLTATQGILQIGAGFSNTSVEGSSSTVTKATSYTLAAGGGGDGINHYDDVLNVTLGSVIDIGSWAFGGNTYKTWTFSTQLGPEVTQQVYLSEVLCALAGFPPPGIGPGTSGILAPLNIDPNFIRPVHGVPTFVFPDPITYDTQNACNSSNPPGSVGPKRNPGSKLRRSL